MFGFAARIGCDRIFDRVHHAGNSAKAPRATLNAEKDTTPVTTLQGSEAAVAATPYGRFAWSAAMSGPGKARSAKTVSRSS
jgi:hypothetical protein